MRDHSGDASPNDVSLSSKASRLPVDVLVPLLLFALYVALNLVGLTRSPVVWTDEVGLNDPARVLAETGRLATSVFGDVDGFNISYHWLPPGQAIVTAAVYRVFGFGIVQTRIMPLLFAAGVVSLSWLIPRRLGYPKYLALMTAGIVFLEPVLQRTARSGRMDGQALFLAALALWLVIGAREKPDGSSLYAVGGILVAFAALTHPAASTWVLGIFIALARLSSHERLRRLSFFTLGVSVPLLFWGLWLLPNLSRFKTQFIDHGLSKTDGGGLVNRIVSEPLDLVRTYTYAPALLLLVVGLALGLVVASIRKERTAATPPWGVTDVLVVSFMLIWIGLNNDTGFYELYYLIPLYLLIPYVFSFASSFGSKSRTIAVVFVVLAAANGLVAGFGQRWLVLASQWDQRDYALVEDLVDNSIEAGQNVYSVAEPWYALVDRDARMTLNAFFDQPQTDDQDAIIFHTGHPPEVSGTWQVVRVGGLPLPPVLGVDLPSADYRLSVAVRQQP